MSEPEESVRWTVLFRGSVQGVGFRFTTRQLAGRFAVSGYVRNLPDGGVEVVAEGRPAELERFVRAVEEAMAGCIRTREQDQSSATAAFEGFSVRY